MAQTRKRRQTKHRGNAVGMIESRGRTGRKPSETEKSSAQSPAVQRGDREPTLRAAVNRAVFSAAVLFVLLLLLLKQSIAAASGLAVVALVIYIPIGYLTDQFVYKRRLAKRAAR